ncbi:MAG: exonuclease SbcCD subunit D [Promethearchaeota archaeon]
MTNENHFNKKFRSSIFRRTKTPDITKFIHASDIHLGAAQYRNKDRANDFFNAFKEILELTIEHYVDFIIFGGDVFTSLEMLPGLLTKIINILRDFQIFTKGNIPIISIEGNHDIRKFSRGIRFEKRSQSWLKLLNSLGLIILLDVDFDLSPKEMFIPYNFEIRKGGKIQIKNIMIYGTQYLGENPISFLSKIRRELAKNNGTFNILLQHFGIEGQMDNVPGVNLKDIQPLRHHIDYLALGHFHKQFILENWIFNPGSSEATCSIDNSFKRGIFLVEISKKSEKFVKNVKIIHLKNRRYIWETVYLTYEFTKRKDLEKFIINKLSLSLKSLSNEVLSSIPQKPLLYLILRGKEPIKSCVIKEKDLRIKLCNLFPIVDVNIYQKFEKTLRTLDNYILA